jgi:tetratricopeptide (TPR) repeat protein
MRLGNIVLIRLNPVIMRNSTYLFAIICLLGLSACSPKTAQQVPPPTPPAPPVSTVKPPQADETLSPCPKFSDAPNKDEAETHYVLYRDFLKANDWNQAFEYWQKVYAVAPAADGRRNNVYADGIRFYEHFLGQTQDTVQREAYITKILEIYDENGRCFPNSSYAPARKAFDLYYTYPHRAGRMEIYNLFKKVIDMDGDKTNDFVINPFTALLVELHLENKIPMAEAQTYAAKVRSIVAYGLANCKEKNCEGWRTVEGYALVRLEDFETVKGFYDCEYYTNKFYAEFEESPTDCDVIRNVYSSLKWGDCSEADAKFQKVIAAGNKNCVEAGQLQMAYNKLRDADYREAIALFEKAAAEEKDRAKKGQIYLIIGQIYYVHLKNFQRARQYAQQAADVKPNWGEPYILIGRLYASSGPLCGPGRGWDSQIVVWPAIDMWNKAKRVDPSSASEANKWINRYSQYMPSREDVFLRNLQVGAPFRVGCWIQEDTTIRTAD